MTNILKIFYYIPREGTHVYLKGVKIFNQNVRRTTIYKIGYTIEAIMPDSSLVITASTLLWMLPLLKKTSTFATP